MARDSSPSTRRVSRGPLSHGFATGHHAAAAPSGETSRKQWVLIAMAVAFTMTMIDATIVSVALPTIQRDLVLSNTERVWIIDAYLLVYTVSIAAAGKFADRLGQRRVFMLGLSLFVVSSAVAGLSPNGSVLIAARAAEGLGGALMTPTSQAMVTNAFPREERGRALGLYAGVSALGVALGPLLGGALTTFLDWYWIFFVNLPVGVAAYFLTRHANPAQSRAADAAPTDWVGLGLLVGGLTALVVAVMQSHSWGILSPSFLGTTAAGIVLVGVFVWFEAHQRAPLLRLRIFADRDFLSDNLVTFFTRFALFGMSVYAPLFVQDVLGFSAFEAGASTLPATVMLILVAPRSGKLYDRIGARPLLSWGSAVSVVGFVWIALALPAQSYVWLIPAYVVIGIGIGVLSSPALTDAMNVAPPAQRGEAAGLLGTVQQLGATAGTAVITAVFVPLFVTRLARGVGEPTVRVQTVLSDTKGGTRPSSVTPEVITAAKEAFAWSLAVSFSLVVVIMALSFLVGFFVHSDSRPTSSGDAVVPG
jgi:EmrB/QacA subfamily drug resistance transporter